jgi:hypothetical protein
MILVLFAIWRRSNDLVRLKPLAFLSILHYTINMIKDILDLALAFVVGSFVMICAAWFAHVICH